MPILASEQACTGCAACANICPHDAIALSPDSEGFLMPKISTDKCVECKLCEKACPIVNGFNLKNPKAENAVAFWDNKTRTQSSSGGAFSAIARWVFCRDGIVFGASWTDDFRCVHSSCESEDDLNRLRGSKYLQSDIRMTYRSVRDALKKGRYVLFAGTPCQVAGLRSFLLKKYDRLITVDIVCHGVPSNQLFCNYVGKLKLENKRYANAISFEFRNLNGWGYAPSIKVSKFKRVLITGTDNLYMGAFSKASVFRRSCYDCQFNGLQRVGDVTIADFWGIGRQGTPFRHDVSKGVSLILVNTPIGREIVDSFSDCLKEIRSLEETVKYNHNLIGSSVLPPNRREIIDAFNSPDMSLWEINKRYKLVGTNVGTKIRDTIIRIGLFWPIKTVINKIRSL